MSATEPTTANNTGSKSDNNTSKDLQILLQELAKSNPEARLVKSKIDILGIPYNSDLIILLSEVLVYLSKNLLKNMAAKKIQQKQLKKEQLKEKLA